MHQGIRETREKKMGEMEIYKWMGGRTKNNTRWSREKQIFSYSLVVKLLLAHGMKQYGQSTLRHTHETEVEKKPLKDF